MVTVLHSTAQHYSPVDEIRGSDAIFDATRRRGSERTVLRCGLARAEGESLAAIIEPRPVYGSGDIWAGLHWTTILCVIN